MSEVRGICELCGRPQNKGAAELFIELERLRAMAIDPRTRAPIVGEMYSDLHCVRLVVGISNAHQIGKTFIDYSVRGGTTNEKELKRATMELVEWMLWINGFGDVRGARLLGWVASGSGARR